MKMKQTQARVLASTFGLFALGWFPAIRADENAAPFPEALRAAAISVDRLDSILDDSLILGNGDVNALVYSEGGQPKLMLTKNDVWDARLDTKLDPPLPTLDLIRKRRGQLPAEVLLPEGMKWKGPDSYDAHPYPCPRACAALMMRDQATTQPRPKAVSGRVDLCQAVVDILDKPVEKPIAQIRALADRNVFLVKSPRSWQLIALKSEDIPEAMAGESDGVSWLMQRLPGDLDWPGMSFAVAMATKGDLTAVAIVTSREAADPKAAAVALARATVASDDADLVQRHEVAWRQFWARSGIKIDEPALSDAWYRSLYFLRCVTKPGAISPGLFAGLTNDKPSWHGDYHTNYNIQQTYWSAYVTNHCELAEPYDRLIHEYMPRARCLCRRIFASDGAYIPHILFAYEPPYPENCKSPGGRQYINHVWGFTLGVAGFSVQPLWWHYKYAPDREFLEKIAYPAIRDVAIFQAEFMDRCEGDERVLLAPTVSPEHWGWTKDFERNRNGTFDIGMFRYIFQAAIEGASILQCDCELVARWQKALKRLPPYPTTAGGQPIVVDVQSAPPITYNIAVPATPVFPCDVVTRWSPPAEKELFVRTIEQLQWNGNNSLILLSVARARLSMPETWKWVQGELTARLRPNGTLTLNRRLPPYPFNNFGHYTEQFAASMAISELLLQSVGDVVCVFPAWPPDREAAFRKLRAQGGFLVSSQQRAGKVAELAVTSTVGGPLRLLSPWPQIRVRRDNGHDAVQLTPDARGVVQLDTRPGEQLVFERTTSGNR